ncbi:MAG TPA: hypothetical protein VMY34_08235 [Acidimicrobiales bacterium]|nr:hypothetical protein [Acidimicrobiales bacterium]
MKRRRFPRGAMRVVPGPIDSRCDPDLPEHLLLAFIGGAGFVVAP